MLCFSACLLTIHPGLSCVYTNIPAQQASLALHAGQLCHCYPLQQAPAAPEKAVTMCKLATYSKAQLVSKFWQISFIKRRNDSTDSVAPVFDVGSTACWWRRADLKAAVFGQGEVEVIAKFLLPARPNRATSARPVLILE